MTEKETGEHSSVAERGTHNSVVGGSNPPAPTKEEAQESVTDILADMAGSCPLAMAMIRGLIQRQLDEMDDTAHLISRLAKAGRAGGGWMTADAIIDLQYSSQDCNAAVDSLKSAESRLTYSGND